MRLAFFDRVVEGWSVSAAAAEAGVAKQSAWDWWRQSAPVTLELARSKVGGLGVVPVVEGVSSRGAPAQRRALTGEDRAVIAACLRRRAAGEKITLAQIGEL
ncbi:hypothetical protein K8U61_23485, partial [Nocardioides sp. GBK3QG-3]